MHVRVIRRDATACRAHHETLLNQIRLEHIFDRTSFFAHSSGEALDADWTAIKFLDDRLEETPIHRIKAVWVNLQHVHGTYSDLACYNAVGLDLGIVPDPAQQSIRYARRAP